MRGIQIVFLAALLGLSPFGGFGQNMDKAKLSIFVSAAANYEDGVIFLPGLGLRFCKHHSISVSAGFGGGFGGTIQYRFIPNGGESRFKAFLGLNGLYFLRTGSGYPGFLKITQLTPGVGFLYFPFKKGFHLFYQNGAGVLWYRGPTQAFRSDFQIQLGMGYEF